MLAVTISVRSSFSHDERRRPALRLLSRNVPELAARSQLERGDKRLRAVVVDDDDAIFVEGRRRAAAVLGGAGERAGFFRPDRLAFEVDGA